MAESSASSKKRSFSEHSSSLPTEANSEASNEESLRAKMKQLLGRDIYPLVHFLQDLYEEDDDKKDLHSEAEALYDYAKKHYPNALVPRTCDLYLNTPFIATQRQCMTLLYRLLLQDGIWDAKNFSIMTRSDLKTRFSECLKKEVDSTALNTLILLVSEIGAKELRKQAWPALSFSMFQSLASTSDHEKHVASRLFKEMIPKCPEIFSPDVELLGLSLENLMGSDSYMVSVPAIRAGLNLVRYLALPDSYQDYRNYLNYVENILFKSTFGNQHAPARAILGDLLALAEYKFGFVRFNISSLCHCMIVIAEISEADMKNRQLAIEFLLKVAENRESGCGLIQKKPDEVRRLLAVLVEMLEPVEDDPSFKDWLESRSDDQDAKVSPAYSFAMNSMSRISNAVRGKVIGTQFLESLNQGMKDTNWKIRHKSVVTLGLVSKGCSQIMEKDFQKLVDNIQNLICDNHLRVRRSAIHTLAKFCKDFSPCLQERFLPHLVTAITGAMEDFHNPAIQAIATLAMQIFSQNCRPGTLKPYLDRIVSKFVMFLQMENHMLKEATLTALASLAASSKKDFLEYYDVVMPHLRVILITAKKNVDCILMAKTVDCITQVGLAVGKEKFHSDVEKVIELLMLLQEPETEMDGSFRSHLLQAWGRLCKFLGTMFLPFLSVVMPQVIRALHSKSDLDVTAKPNNMKDLDYDRVTENGSIIRLLSDELNSRASACNVFSWLAAELEGRLHMWIHEVENALVPLVNFEPHEEVRAAAMSSMPLLLQSAVSAMKKGLPLDGFSESSCESLTRSIITALLDALWKETKTEIVVKIMEALTGCMQVAGCHLKEEQVKQFLDGMNEFLTTSAYEQTEREKRVNQGLDLREKELLEEENKQEEEVYQKIGDCLETFVKTYKASVPLFNEILQFIERLWEADETTEERNIGVRIFHVFAKECQANSHEFNCDRCLPKLLEACSQENPEVQKAVARGIAICAEFGPVDFKHYLEDAVSKLRAIILHPKAILPRKVMAHEAAVSALGRICLFHFHEIKTPEVFLLLLNNLPIKNDSEEAKIAHDQLCLMLAMSENKMVIGPEGANIPRIIEIFAEVLWAGSHLATDNTINSMKKLLKLFQQQTPPETWDSILSTLPNYQQKMLQRILC